MEEAKAATSGSVRPETALGEIVREQPAAAAVFERLGFDFCCGGGQSLGEACEAKGLEPSTVAVMLEALPEPGAGAAGHDLGRASIPEICDHIIREHHEPFRQSTARLTETIATVVRVHGPDHPELVELEEHFVALRDDMLRHAAREESELFPAAIEASNAGSTLDPAILAELESDHRQTGQELEAINRLCDGYALDRAYCGTHRLMLMNLKELEEDTHQHVHEENNILFPLVREQLAA